MRGELLRSGISVCFLGAPNAGKSSLLNRIVGREAAIVSPEPGTTRDVVDLAVDIGGYMVLVGDTAGLRPVSTASGKVEIEGMRRARERVRAADIVVAVVDASRDIPPEDGDAVVDTLQLAESEGKRVVVVGNKIDLLSPASPTSSETATIAGDVLSHLRSHLPTNTPIIPLSCLTGTGVPYLLSTLTDLCTELTSPLTTSTSSDSTPLVITPAEAESSLAATQRQKLLLLECQQHLQNFISMCEDHESTNGDLEGEEVDIVLAAELLRDAAEALGKVVGRGEQGDVEEVLGVVFEKFCVGK